LQGTVNPSTSVSVGSSPTAPTLYPKQEIADLRYSIKYSVLRKFYALDYSKLAQCSCLSFLISSQNIRIFKFFGVTSETSETLSVNSVSLYFLFCVTGVTKIYQIKIAEAKKHTLGELIDRFITTWLPKYPKRQAKQTALLTWWKNRLGHLLLANVTPSILAESRDALLLENTRRAQLRSSSTVNRYLAALSKSFTVAVQEWGWLDSSPMPKVSKR
jgi:hypothetical protein